MRLHHDRPGALGARLIVGAELVHGRLEVVLEEVSLVVNDEQQAVPAAREHVVLQRHRAELGEHDVAQLVVQERDPLGELSRVRDRGAQERAADLVGQQHDRLLPDDPALSVAHVVDLVEDHPADLAHDRAAPVQHRLEDLRGHDQHARVRRQGHVTGQQADFGEFLGEFPIFLIAERFDWRRVYDSLFVSERFRYGVSEWAWSTVNELCRLDNGDRWQGGGYGQIGTG